MGSIDLVQLTQETKKLTAMIVDNEQVANELLSSTFKNFFGDVQSCFNESSRKIALKSRNIGKVVKIPCVNKRKIPVFRAY